MSFLDKEGLRYFWQGAKKKFYNKSEIDSQREELQKGIDDASKTGGVEVGTIVYIEDDAEVPEGWNVVERDNALPIGSGMDYYGATVPKGYMFADGSAISRTEYAELFKIFGTTYGAGDGSTTFNLPDKRSRVSVTKDNGTFNTLGKTGGAETHQLTVSEIPAHEHHFMTGIHQTSAPAQYGYYPYRSADISDNSIFTSETGGGQAHNNLQPYLVCNYIIKVKSLKAIMKVAVTPIEPKTGHIYDTTNIDNKAENTYSANVIDGVLNGGKVKVKTISNMTPSTYSNNTYLVTDIPLKNTSILSIFCKNRYGYNFIPLQYTNVNADNWVITDTKNSLTGTFSLTIVYFEFDNSINMYSD